MKNFHLREFLYFHMKNAENLQHKEIIISEFSALFYYTSKHTNSNAVNF